MPNGVEKEARGIMRTLGERAPDLLALLVVVGMFLYHLQGANKDAVAELRGTLTRIEAALSEEMKSNAELREAVLRGIEKREAEHNVIDRTIERACGERPGKKAHEKEKDG